MCFNFFSGGGFFYCDDNILISFLELGVFNIDAFVFFCVFNIDSRPSFFVFSPVTRVLFWRADQEGSHNTSMVTSHVDHVVRFSVFHVAQVSSLGQDVVNLLLFPFWRDEGRLFLWRFF